MSLCWKRVNRYRVDVFLLYRGFRVAIEGSYDSSDVEEDARTWSTDPHHEEGFTVFCSELTGSKRC